LELVTADNIGFRRSATVMEDLHLITIYQKMLNYG